LQRKPDKTEQKKKQGHLCLKEGARQWAIKKKRMKEEKKIDDKVRSGTKRECL